MSPTPLLDRITTPADVKQFSRDELPQLAEELRNEIVNIVSHTGGHFASPLGAVDLIVALHYVFDAPRDRLVFDVGHQSYAHKLLTGRREAMQRLRLKGGASGFLRRDESEHDAFGAGHASTSISAGLGMAVARDLTAASGRKVVAVIGDGAMTGGLAFEGLNNAGHLGTDLIVVLNDNEMSISPNVGAISAYLNRIMTGSLYTRFRDNLGGLLKQIPSVGSQMARLARKTEEMAKGLVAPGLLFEELGFTYVGPIPGHDYGALIDTLQNVKAMRGPILVHVVTKKGKGYEPAEGDPVRYHGVSAGFAAPKGEAPAAGAAAPAAKAKPPVLTYTGAFVQHLVGLARRDPRIVAITAAMPEGTGLDRFQREFPNRCFDVGIAEQHGVCFAAGLAAEGMRPVAAIYSTFLQRAYDQIIHDVAIQALPVTFAMDRGGLVGADGATHHGVFDYGYLRIVPDLVCMAPKDENELGRMLRTAIDLGAPAALRYPRGKGAGVPLDDDPQPLEVGQAEVLAEGDDLAIVAIGQSVAEALVAAGRLAADGIHATVVNARFVKPLDLATLERVARRTGRLLTVEDHVLAGGFGTAVLEGLEALGLLGEVQIRRLGIPDRFIEHGTQEELRAEVGIDAAGIERATRGLLASPLRPGSTAGRGTLRVVPPPR